MELMHRSIFGSTVGRHVYMCIVGNLVQGGKINSVKSLKQIFSHPALTDRAIRLKLRELEDINFIKFIDVNGDARHRHLEPTDMFLRFIDEYQREVSRIFLENFFLISKNKE